MVRDAPSTTTPLPTMGEVVTGPPRSTLQAGCSLATVAGVGEASLGENPVRSVSKPYVGHPAEGVAEAPEVTEPTTSKANTAAIAAHGRAKAPTRSRNAVPTPGGEAYTTTPPAGHRAGKT